MPIPLIAAIKNGVDFSDVFAERGLAPNGVEFLPTFFDLNLRASLLPKVRPQELTVAGFFFSLSGQSEVLDFQATFRRLFL